MLKTTKLLKTRSGLTLVELLVVITIMTILAALLVPQLRMVNKERNIREAARLVASTFASASQRAIDEGIAGVEIVRNPNIVDNGDVNFAGTTLYVLREQPAYTGDYPNAVAIRGGGNTMTIPRPFEQDDLDIVQVGDLISFNYSAVKYEISGVGGGSPMALTLDVDAVQPPLPGGAGDTFPFVVFRQPKRLESSRVDLPEGYVIDLRFSGQINPDPVGFPQDTMTGPNPIPHNPRPFFYETTPATDSVEYRFNSKGGVNSLIFTDSAWASPQPVFQTEYLLIREYDPDENFDTVLEDGNNLWVTVNQATGAVNVAYVAPAPMDTSLVESVTAAGQVGRLQDQIFRSQQIAIQRQSANQ